VAPSGTRGRRVEARERLAHVEGLAVAIVGTVVGRLERGLRPELAGKQTRSQGHPRDDADVTAARLVEEAVRGTLAHDVEDDLDAGDTRMSDGRQRLVDPFHAHAVVGHDAVRDELVESGVDLASCIEGGRRTVQLDEVEGRHAEVLPTAREPVAEGLGRVVLDLLGNTPAHLGRDH
jgi:hypothetical protein